MLFNSIQFAIFLPIVFAIYWSAFREGEQVRQKLRWQNAFIVLVSYLFYGWWDWRFLSLIIFSSTVDFWIGQKMESHFAKAEKSRKQLLWLSLGVNLGLLGIFKYYDFFISEFITAFAKMGVNLHVSTLRIILPVGISFYTFQTLSYTIDVYQKKLPAVRDWTVFFAYVSFFPQLVAGPIERATQLIPQFSRKRAFDYQQAKDGMRQILLGLFKKVVIADNCAGLVDRIFQYQDSYGTGGLALGAFLFAIQIYCDFSGYSDIAIGTARLFGFNLMRNFAFPYFSRDIAEFWRRWHISLSTWFRDYLYIPLGGSRVESRGKLIRNIFIIFLVSGFWHGANWTFLAWGGLHACYFLPSILLNKNRRYLNTVAENRWLPSVKETFQMLWTFSLVCVAWVFFRAESIGAAVDYLISAATNFELNKRLFTKNIYLFLCIIVLFVIEWLHRNRQHGFEFDDQKTPRFVRMMIYLSAAMAILLLSPRAPSNFIYFQF